MLKYYTWIIDCYSRGETYLDAVGLIGYDGYAEGDNVDPYSCDGTPFVEGTNAIVIPTSLFTRTELHHYIETEQLEETALYSAEEGLFEMIAIEHNGTPDVACGDVDYVFIRCDISPNDAMTVLAMVLQGMVEETRDENDNMIYLNGTINEYLSLKLDGIRATLLNLPYASLGYLPWVMDLINSPTGPQPHPADPWGIFLWLITWLIPILHVIIIIIVNMLASDSTGFIVNFATSILMKLMTALGNLLWVIIRAAILVFAWLTFAIVLPFVMIGFLTAAAGIYCILTVKNIDCSITFNTITINTETLTAMFGYECNLIYIDFFDIIIPSIDMFYRKDTINLNIPYNIYSITLNSLNSESLYALAGSVTSSNQTISSGENEFVNMISGGGATMAFIGSFMGILANFWAPLDTRKDIAFIILSTIIFEASLILFLMTFTSKATSGMFLGIGAGFITSAPFALHLWTGERDIWDPLKYISLGFAALSLLLSILELYNPDFTLGIEIARVILGILALIFGTLAATYLTGESQNKRTLLGFFLFWLAIIYGLTFTIIGAVMFFSN